MTGSDWSGPVLGSRLRMRERLSAFGGSSCAPCARRAGRCPTLTEEVISLPPFFPNFRYLGAGGHSNEARLKIAGAVYFYGPSLSCPSRWCPSPHAAYLRADLVNHHPLLCTQKPLSLPPSLARRCFPGRGREGGYRVSGGSNTMKGLS